MGDINPLDRARADAAIAKMQQIMDTEGTRVEEHNEELNSTKREFFSNAIVLLSSDFEHINIEKIRHTVSLIISAEMSMSVKFLPMLLDEDFAEMIGVIAVVSMTTGAAMEKNKQWKWRGE